MSIGLKVRRILLQSRVLLSRTPVRALSCGGVQRALAAAARPDSEYAVQDDVTGDISTESLRDRECEHW